MTVTIKERVEDRTFAETRQTITIAPHYRDRHAGLVGPARDIGPAWLLPP
jgi:hypothetical protein